MVAPGRSGSGSSAASQRLPIRNLPVQLYPFRKYPRNWSVLAALGRSDELSRAQVPLLQPGAAGAQYLVLFPRATEDNNTIHPAHPAEYDVAAALDEL